MLIAAFPRRTSSKKGAAAASFAVFASAVSLLSFPASSRAQQAPPPPPEVEPATPPAVPPPATPPTEPQTPTGSTPPPPVEAGSPPSSSGGQGGGGRYLLLPDISFNGILLGHLTNDKRDLNRDKLRFDQGEIAIQSYVYPGVRLESFITFDDGGAGIEEGFLTFQNVSFLKQNFTAVLGRRKVPFGRVNQLHPHAWLYIVQPYVLSNLVASESLTGDGGYLSYLLPTGKLFAQLDVGYWSRSTAGDTINALQNPSQEVISSPGSGFDDRFQTARLWTAGETLGGNLEIGGSLAHGRGSGYSFAPISEEAQGLSVRPVIDITGLDLTYRRAGKSTSRLLLRGEYVHHHQKDGSFKRNTDGFYVTADQRLSQFNSVGIRYDESGFPFADGKERGVTLIGTHQLTEATYFRAQYIHGARPGKNSFDEIHFEVVFGAGPHTHNLE